MSLLQKKKEFATLIAFLLIVQFLGAVISLDHLIVSDQFERMRISSEIVKTEDFPETDNIYGISTIHSYPPLFDVLLASLTILSGDEFLALKLLSFIAFFLLTGFSFLLARKFFSLELSLLFALLVSFNPWFMKRLLGVIPEPLGFALFIAVIYFLTEKNHQKLALAFLFLPLIHLRNTANAVLAIILFITLVFLKEKKIDWKTLSSVVPGMAVFLLWNYDKLDSVLTLQSFQNPWVLFNGEFAIPLVVIGFGGLAFEIMNKKKIKDYFKDLNEFFMMKLFGLFSFIVLVFYFFGSKFFALRELVFLLVPLIFFSTKLVEKVELRSKIAAGGLVLILIALFAFTPLTEAGNDSYFTQERMNGIQKLNDFEGETVFTDFVGSYAVPYYTNKKIVAGAFMESLPDAQERAEDSFNAFEKCEISSELIKKYDIDLIHLSHFWTSKCAKPANKNFELLIEEGDYLIYRVNQ